MENFLIMDFGIKLFYALVALVCMYIVLRGRDKLIGLDFKENFKGIKDDPQALALYLGLTGIGVAIVISSFF